MLPDNSAPAALAATLLHEWEAAARPAPTPAYRAAHAGLLVRLAQFVALLLRPDDVNINPADARTVLGHAKAFRLGHAATTGPGRASRIGLLLAADLALFPPAVLLAGLRPVAALFSLQSGTEHDLEMDELTEIVEAIQQNFLSRNTEMIFGHGIAPEADEAGLQAWLLVGYATEPPVPVAVRNIRTMSLVPDEQGRDNLLKEAASLFVRQQWASSGLLQRELKIGYSRSQRLMAQLAQAGIIGHKPTDSRGKIPILVTTETELMRYLTDFSPLIE